MNWIAQPSRRIRMRPSITKRLPLVHYFLSLLMTGKNWSSFCPFRTKLVDISGFHELPYWQIRIKDKFLDPYKHGEPPSLLVTLVSFSTENGGILNLILIRTRWNFLWPPYRFSSLPCPFPGYMPSIATGNIKSERAIFCVRENENQGLNRPGPTLTSHLLLRIQPDVDARWHLDLVMHT